jgi:beta-1,4-mannosyltransferase
MTTPQTLNSALHTAHTNRQAGRRFLRNAIWKMRHPRSKLVLYGPAVFENPYQTLIYSEFCARVSVSSVQRSLTYRRFGIADVYHFHWDEFHLHAAPNGTDPSYRAPLEAFRALGGKLVWTVHNAEPHDGMSAEKQALFHAGRQFLCNTADLIHVHSDPAQALLCARYNADPARILVLPHPSYEGWYAPASTLPAPNLNTRFLAFGSFRANKGLALILAGFEGLPDNVEFDGLHIAGRGADAAGETPLPGRRVKITSGFIPNDNISGLFGEADFAVFGFSQILTSGSLLLALTYGAVPIAPDLPLLRDVLPDALHQFLYAPGDAQDLVRVLTKAAQITPENRLDLRTLAQDTAAKVSPARISSALCDAIARLS